MAEINRGFSKSKMNRDFDERIVPDGEYREALNIQISASEDSNVGSAQTLLGNTWIEQEPNSAAVLLSGPGGYVTSTDINALPSSKIINGLTGQPAVPTGSTCIGAITDDKNNKIYWFVAGPAFGNLTTDYRTSGIWADYILEYDIGTKQIKYVFVDIYRVNQLQLADANNTDVFSMISVNGIRKGMRVFGIPETSGPMVIPLSYQAEVVETISVNGGIGANFPATTPAGQIRLWSPTVDFGSVVTVASVLNCVADRVLNFDKDRFITSINIIDGMLLWTDGVTEPKKINIERSIAGTGGSVNVQLPNETVLFTGDNPYFHTRLTVTPDSGSKLQIKCKDYATSATRNNTVEFVKEENITVIRKGPLKAPHVKMSNIEASREDINGVANETTTFSDPLMADSIQGAPGPQSFMSANDTVKEPGEFVSNIVFAIPVDFRVGDTILFNQEEEDNYESFTDHDVRATCTASPLTFGGSPPYTESAGPYTFRIEAIASKKIDTELKKWSVKLEQTKPLFEFKFPRFSYRYKYEDGEYSTFAPWSEIAFMPADYDYLPKKGFNLGMTNQARNIKVLDYVPEDSLLPQDVVEIDILYKESNSPNVYTVKTIKATDKYPLWPHRNDSSGPFFNDKSRGECEIESELIHATVPSNQLLRHWDNVPRKAKAQEMSGNRLVYGNYVQNYNIDNAALLKDDKSIQVDLQVSLDTKSAPLYNSGAYDLFPTPGKSIKSLRTYQAGVVYVDEYGRETPVLTGDPLTSTIKVEKENASTLNRLNVRVASPPPDWAKYWKIFIKETSNEYYNMAMDRWYDAEDGNIWLSFQSSDRNKLDEDSFLILKKQHDNNIPVTDKARYKVLAISNEAPTYIRLDDKKQGQVTNNTAKTWIGNASNHFPFVKQKTITLTMSGLIGEMGQSATKVQESIAASQLYLRITKTDGTTSKWYQIAKFNGTSLITIDGRFGDDARFASPDQTWTDRANGLGVEFTIRKPEKKPEFDGRFFVKIYKDLVLVNNLLKASLPEYSVKIAQKFGYFNIGGLKNLNHVGGGSLSDWETVSVTHGNNSLWEGTKLYKTPNCNSQDDDAWCCERFRETLRWWQDGQNVWFIDKMYARSSGSAGASQDYAACNASCKDGCGRGAGLTHHGSYSKMALAVTTGSSTRPTGGFIDAMMNTDTVFRFKEDPWKILYKVTEGITQTRWLNAIGQWSDPTGCGDPEWNHGNHRHRWQIKFTRFAEYDITDEKYYQASPMAMDASGSAYDPIGTNNVAANFHQSSTVGPHDPYEEMMYADTQYAFPNGQQHQAGKVGSKSRDQACFRHTIEIMEPFIESGDDVMSSENPATWETEPKEDVGIDIYYEASNAFPLEINAATNELMASYGSRVDNEGPIELPTGAGSTWVGGTARVVSWSAATVTLSSDSLNTNQFPTAINDVLSFTHVDGTATRLIAKSAHAGGAAAGNFTIDIRAISEATEWNVGVLNGFTGGPHAQMMTLGYSNCFAFGNGIESDRIRDDYNQVRVGKGVKASTVMAEKYVENHRATGLIHSGKYNSISGVNDLNQFIQAEPITKDLNPQYGPIEKLYTRNNDIVAFCQDKVWKVAADKLELFNADGSSNLSKSSVFLGTANTFAADYGTQNPESMAANENRIYFADVARGAILRLSNDGITNISDYGMKDWFGDNLIPTTTRVLGSFDNRKSLYNVTIKGLYPVSELDGSNDNNDVAPDCDGCGGGPQLKQYVDPGDATDPDMNNVKINVNSSNLTSGDFKDDYTNQSYYYSSVTLSFNEKAKGWISFKSFVPEAGVSINNKYYTFYDGELFSHHSNKIRNNFYGEQFDSQIKVLFNDAPEVVKSFGTLKYEGTASKIIANSTDDVGPLKEYYNLFSKSGWYVNEIKTDLQTGGALEFKGKEGKYFSTMYGEVTNLNNLDTSEFSVQGINSAASVSIVGPINDEFCLTVEPEIFDGCEVVRGCTDPYATNYDFLANTDDGSCIYGVLGCTDAGSPCFNGDATIDDGSCCYPGCMIVGDPNYDPDATYDDGSCDNYGTTGCLDPYACNYDAGASIDCLTCCCYISGCTDAFASNFNKDACCDDGSCEYWGCMYGGALVNDAAWWASSPYSGLTIQTTASDNYWPGANLDDGSCQWCAGYALTAPTNTQESGPGNADGSLVLKHNIPAGYYYTFTVDMADGSTFDNGIVYQNAGAAAAATAFFTLSNLISGAYTINGSAGPDNNADECQNAISVFVGQGAAAPTVLGCTYGGAPLPNWTTAIGTGANALDTWQVFYAASDPGVAATNYDAAATDDDGSCSWGGLCVGNTAMAANPVGFFEEHIIDSGWDVAPVDGLVPTANICPVTELIFQGIAISQSTDPFTTDWEGIQDFQSLQFIQAYIHTFAINTLGKLNSKTNPTTVENLFLYMIGDKWPISLESLTGMEQLIVENYDIDHWDTVYAPTYGTPHQFLIESEEINSANTGEIDLQHYPSLTRFETRNTKFAGITKVGANVMTLKLNGMAWFREALNTPGIDISGSPMIWTLEMTGMRCYNNFDFTIAASPSGFLKLKPVGAQTNVKTLILRGVNGYLTGNTGGINTTTFTLNLSTGATSLQALDVTHYEHTSQLWADFAPINNIFYSRFKEIKLNPGLQMVQNSGNCQFFQLGVTNRYFEVWGAQGDSFFLAANKELHISVGAGIDSYMAAVPTMTDGLGQPAHGVRDYNGTWWYFPQNTTRVDFMKFFFSAMDGILDPYLANNVGSINTYQNSLGNMQTGRGHYASPLGTTWDGGLGSGGIMPAVIIVV
tara:strand:+ start:2636 stop:10954 length:8319 start_codon:yes stop_codon:yes gene_type:complete